MSLSSRCCRPMLLSKSWFPRKASWALPVVCWSRCLSTTTKFVDVSLNQDTDVATVTLQRPPVNSLNLELLQQLNTTLDSLEKSECRGMILTSSSPTIFSAGLDILEMYKPKPDRLRQFWTALQDAWLKLYGSSYPTVAVINGHSPAGGCLLALSCEYRVMVGPNFTVGLNETRLGIVAPRWFMMSMSNVLGVRQTELALTTGRMFTTDEALAVGLVDQVAADKNDALLKASDFLEKFSAIPPVPRSLAKQVVRQETLDWMVQNKQADLERFLAFVGLPAVQQGLELYLAALKNKSKQ